ncbi:glycosyltransferase [Vibrio coralliirubri]|uniref:glycosyltransferase n=1 Tax=Vibrio coralliirubri TaxID=1516159 RepID=UPI0013C52594|nr:glycosyltransferase [Vibrio coralliirubri]
MRKTLFFGRFPAKKEVGGVTTFTFDFAEKFKNQDVEFVDIYPAVGKKEPAGAKIHYITGFTFIRYIKFILFCSFNKNNLFFNFSTLKSLIVFFFIPKSSESKWSIIFHNGEQEELYRRSNIFTKFIIRHLLCRFDKLGCLSSKQVEFFGTITKSQLCRVTPFIESGTLKKTKLNIEESSGPVRFLISGFPREIYRIEEIVDLFKSLDDKKFLLNVCLYGYGNEVLRSRVCNLIDNTVNVKLHSHLNKPEFDKILESTDVYLRPNSVDSFGLVVAEAIFKGGIVIATNVCERYPGTHLYKTDDYFTLKNEIEYIIKNRSTSNNLLISSPVNDLITYEEFIEHGVQ